MNTLRFDAASERDLRIVSAQLERPVRDVVGIAARCRCGTPTVVATSPRLADESPFPTFYYLTHPEATAEMSRLEADHVMVELNELLGNDAEMRAQYTRAHERYINDRVAFGDVPEIAGVSAGGMPVRVKCLHAVLAHTLASGPGVNPVGDIALERSAWSPEVCRCAPLE